MAKVKQWHKDAAKGFLVGPNLSDSSVQKAAQIIADAEPAREAPKGEWVKCAFGCGVDVHTNPSDPRARQSVQNHLCLNKVAALKAQMDAIFPSATGPTPDTLEPEEFIKAAFPDADLDKLEINARIVIKWLHEALAYAASKSGATPPTRFDEFDDTDHPFRKWWETHGQFMLSGGGRRESIWAARGWIAREQLAVGVEVTGDSMHEKNAGATPGGEARTQSPIAYLSDKCKCGHSMGEHDFGSTNRKRRYCGSCDCPYWNPVKVAESAPIPPTDEDNRSEFEKRYPKLEVFVKEEADEIHENFGINLSFGNGLLDIDSLRSHLRGLILSVIHELAAPIPPTQPDAGR